MVFRKHFIVNAVILEELRISREASFSILFSIKNHLSVQLVFLIIFQFNYHCFIKSDIPFA